MTCFFSYESPNLIGLDFLAAQIAHLGIHQLHAPFTSDNQQANDCVPVQASNALCAANAGSFEQELNCQQSFIFGNGHSAKQALMFFSVGFSALRAAKPFQAIAVLSKTPTFDAACLAIHE